MKYLIEGSTLSDIGQAIRSRTGVDRDIYPSEMAGLIRDIEVSDVSANIPLKDINFIDYDGDCLYSYTFEEAKNLTTLPILPYHTGLVCQGWNYSLDDIKLATTPINVGANYITDNGCTRIYIKITEPYSSAIWLNIYQSELGCVSVNWGDGVVNSNKITNYPTFSHSYNKTGDYTIEISSSKPYYLGFGNGDNRGFLTISDAKEASMLCNYTTKVELGENVINITERAFYRNHNMESITIPISVTNIGNEAFRYCQKLKGLIIPKNITMLNGGTLRDCYNIRNISLPSSITTISRDEFRNSVNLECISLPENLTSIDSNALDNLCIISRITTPKKLKSIGSYAFKGVSNLRYIYLNRGLESIGNFCFNGCELLKSIIIPYGVETIPQGCFSGCYNLEYITIPESVTNIEASSFSGLTKLKSILYGGTEEQWNRISISSNSDIDNKITITYNCHFDTFGLGDVYTYSPDIAAPTDVNIPETLLGETVVEISSHAFEQIDDITSVVIPQTVQLIRNNAFDNCVNLKTVTINNPDAEIYSQAFKDCTSLTSFQLPQHTTIVNQALFSGCTNLSTVHIPNTVNHIRKDAFKDCDALTDVYFSGDEREWGEIVIEEGNDCLLNAVIHVESDDFINFTYEIIDNNAKTLRITGLKNQNVTNLNIWESINGYSVVEIGSSAFKNNSNLLSVKFPNALRLLHHEAFKGCTNLRTVENLHENINAGYGVFEGCQSLASVSVLCSNIPQSMFKDCTYLSKVKLKNAIQIYDGAFENCYNLKSIYIPTATTYIGENAFNNAGKLTATGMHVYYEGRIVDWDYKISIADGNDSLNEATYYEKSNFDSFAS